GREGVAAHIQPQARNGAPNPIGTGPVVELLSPVKEPEVTHCAAHLVTDLHRETDAVAGVGDPNVEFERNGLSACLFTERGGRVDLCRRDVHSHLIDRRLVWLSEAMLPKNPGVVMGHAFPRSAAERYPPVLQDNYRGSK